jgi:hypothetical protein
MKTSVQSFKLAFRQLGPTDRISLWLILIITPIVAVCNWIRVSSESVLLISYTTIVALLMWAAVFGTITYSIAVRGRSPANYGFTLRLGTLISWVAVFIMSLLKSTYSDYAIPDNWIESSARLIGATCEELLFRAIAINVIGSALRASGRNDLWAIPISAALWVLPHVPTKEIGFLPFLFLTGVILGFIYRYSRSILFPMWGHVVANASWLGGVIVIVIYVIVSAYGLIRERSAAARVALQAETGGGEAR